ncbi:MAG: MAPEG family protein [Rhodocyclaceae bacterium]|nr:MAPEG family protein [Rhodocyclaceae bacterium]MBL0076827.1 MAPEG family protein [Rhodocyclaceae bacterium]MBP6110193.1 MAPEG family protein [Rhodocyclaceae bacterium]MBP6280040.1 MAPEG family protein [Rhodocyclaceae bacterium]
MHSDILQPVVALLVWTFVMWAWMYATRLPAISKYKIPLDSDVPPRELMNKLPPNVRWKADNYNHLMEAPTLFYAVAMTLAVTGAGSGVIATIAWAYVALRVLHSLVQATTNHIPTRFALFFLSSLVLAALVIKAAIVVF